MLATKWCTFADLLNEAVNNNPEQANQWLRQQRDRLTHATFLLRQEPCSVNIDEIVAATDIQHPPEQSWLRLPPWLAHKRAQILKAGHCWPELMELSAFFS